MARMLNKQNSSRVHLNACRRHIRFCNQFKSAEKYALTLQPAYDNLIQKTATVQTLLEKRQDALDDLLQYHADLVNAVRTVFDRCKGYMRQNPNDPILNLIFPEGRYGDIIEVPRPKLPVLVEQIALKIESLGETHPLFLLAAELRSQIKAPKEAFEAFQASARAYQLARAEEAIARANLRKQYEINYLEARKEYGRATADHLFPQINSKVSREEQKVAEEIIRDNPENDSNPA